MEKRYRTEVEEEFANDGLLAILIPGIGIFLLFAFLAKFGFEPAEVWAFIKMLMFSSSWDYQLGYEFSQFLRAGTSVLSIIGLIAVATAALTTVDYLIDFFKSRKLFVLKLFFVIFTLVYKLIMFLTILNFMILVLRVIYHICAGILVWLW